MTRGTLLLALLWALSACGPGVNSGFDPADAGPGTPPGKTPPANPPPVQPAAPEVTRTSTELRDVEATEVRIRVEGTGFQAASVLYWREQEVATTFVSETLLEGVLRLPPEGLAWGEASLTVRNPGNGSSQGRGLGYPVPQLSGMTPTSILAGTESPVKVALTGRNLVRGSVAVFRGVEYPVTVLSPTAAEVELPTSALASGPSGSGSNAGAFMLRVPRPLPHSSNSLTLTLLNPVPQIVGVEPQVLSTTLLGDTSDGGSGQPITRNLQVRVDKAAWGTVVKWNGKPLEGVVPFVGGFYVPLPPEARTAPGTVALTLEAPSPGGGESAPYTVLLVDAPVLHAVYPQRIAAGSAELWLELRGEGFESGSVLYWDSQALVTENDPYSTGRADTLRARVPAQFLIQPGTVALTLSRHRDGALSEALFVEVVDAAPAPVAVSMEPMVMTVGDTPVRLHVQAAGFQRNSVIHIDGKARTTWQEDSSGVRYTQLEAADLAQAGVRSVTVHTPGPGGGTSLPLLLKVDSRRKVPLPTTLIPQSVEAGSGALKLHLKGSGLGPYSLVRWNGEVLPTRWLEVCCDSGYRMEYRLEADVPASRLTQAGIARVTVFNPAPGGGLSLPLSFVIAEKGVPSLHLDEPLLEVGSPVRSVYLSGSNITEETRVLVDGESRAPSSYFGGRYVSLALTDADVATARTLELRTLTPGFPPSHPQFLSVVPARPPHLASLNPGVVSAGAWPAGQKRWLVASGVGLAPHEYSLGGVTLTSTLDWGGTPHPLAYSTWGYYGLGAALPGEDVAAVYPREVSVSRAEEGGGVSLPALLNVVAERPVPYLESVAPATVRAGMPALRLYLTGYGFHSASVARWNGQVLPTRWVDLYSSGNWQLEALVPAALLTTRGVARVTVETPAPGGGTSLPISISVQ